MEGVERPLSVFAEGLLIEKVHSSLMAFHQEAFRKVGIDSASVPKPSLVAIGNWVPEATLAPMCAHFQGSWKQRAVARAPLRDYPLYIADVDYGIFFGSTYNSCWAAASLAAAEKVLQSNHFPHASCVAEPLVFKTLQNFDTSAIGLWPAFPFVECVSDV